MKNHLLAFLLLAGLLLVLAACSSAPSVTPASGGLSPEAVKTAAAQTAEAMRLQRVAQTAASPAGGTPVSTQAESPTNIPPSPAAAPVTATVESTAAPGVPPTAAVLPTAAPVTATVPVGGDKAEFVADMTVPDGTIFKPGEAFVKTWRLRNNGNSTWTTAYQVVFAKGTQLGAVTAVPLPANVPPGQTVDVSVTLTAPAEAGSYRSFWNLKNVSGQIFGVGPSGNEAFWVDIAVQGGAASTGTPAPGISGSKVSQVALVVDNASFSGQCPHSFTFTAQFFLPSQQTVSYRLDATASYELDLPAPDTTTLGPGFHALTYTLNFGSSVRGTAQFVITAPEVIESAPVGFELSCQK